MKRNLGLLLVAMTISLVACSRDHTIPRALIEGIPDTAGKQLGFPSDETVSSMDEEENDDSEANMAEYESIDPDKFNLPENDIFQITDTNGNLILTSMQIEDMWYVDHSFEIGILLTPAGKKMFEDFTEREVEPSIIAMVEGNIICNCVPRTMISDGVFYINDFSSTDEANKIVDKVMANTSNLDVRRARVVYNRLLPKEYWNNYVDDHADEIYNASDGEWVSEDGRDKFKINGIYLSNKWVKEDDLTYYFIDQNGNKGRYIGYDFTDDLKLVNYYPGTTEARDLNYPNIEREVLLSAIINSMHIEYFGEGNYRIELGNKYHTDSYDIAYADCDFISDAGWVGTRKNGGIYIELSTQTKGNETINQMSPMIREILLLFTSSEVLDNALSMIEFGDSDQEFIIDGYDGKMKIKYWIPIHGNCITIESM